MRYQQSILKAKNNEEFKKLEKRVVEDQINWYREGISADSVLHFKKGVNGYFSKGSKAILVVGERQPQFELIRKYSDIDFSLIPIENISEYKKVLTDEYYNQQEVLYKYSDREMDTILFNEDFGNVDKEFESEEALKKYLNDYSFIYTSAYDFISYYHYINCIISRYKNRDFVIQKEIDFENSRAIIYTTLEKLPRRRTSDDLIITWELKEKKPTGELVYTFSYQNYNKRESLN